MATGTVTRFRSKKQFGSIKVDEGGERIVHTRDLVETSRSLQKGCRVEFEDKPDGIHVTNVLVIDESSTDVPAVESHQQKTEALRPMTLEEAPVVTGTVTRFDQYGRGVIVQDGDGPNVYVDYKSIVFSNSLEEGQRVMFNLVNGEKGPQAKMVYVIEEPPTNVPAVESRQETNVDQVARFAENAKKQSPTSKAMSLKPQGSYSGTVKRFNNGYGFISVDDGPDVFVHHTGIAGTGYRTLDQGQKVHFDVERGPKGLMAVNVQVGSTLVWSSSSNS